MDVLIFVAEVLVGGLAGFAGWLLMRSVFGRIFGDRATRFEGAMWRNALSQFGELIIAIASVAIFLVVIAATAVLRRLLA